MCLWGASALRILYSNSNYRAQTFFTKSYEITAQLFIAVNQERMQIKKKRKEKNEINAILTFMWSTTLKNEACCIDPFCILSLHDWTTATKVCDFEKPSYLYL